MVEYSLANIHLGVGCRYKVCPNLLLHHLSSPKERCSSWKTPRLGDGKVMKSLSVQKDILKMSKSTQATAPPSLLPKAPVTVNHPHHVSSRCPKSLHDQHKVTAVTVTLPTARNQDVSPELKEKFEEICQNRGIPQENILDFTKAGKFTSLWYPLPESLCY